MNYKDTETYKYYGDDKATIESLTMSRGTSSDTSPNVHAEDIYLLQNFISATNELKKPFDLPKKLDEVIAQNAVMEGMRPLAQGANKGGGASSIGIDKAKKIKIAAAASRSRLRLLKLNESK